ncbi:MAG: hypothetical protein F6K21_25360, partial [Symploca sp. SIO2D2]|nr:hypothetical protein [Symploca sp. SIO2D2]
GAEEAEEAGGAGGAGGEERTYNFWTQSSRNPTQNFVHPVTFTWLTGKRASDRSILLLS